MKIQIFVTGGTFDKEYNEITGKLHFTETHMGTILNMGRSRLNVSVETLMMKDSMFLTPEDKEVIVQKCLETDAKGIVITHGTDTMAHTARLIAEKVKNKTIILTGAMIPYVFGTSDGLFNLGSSLAFVQSLKPNVYISMNGQYFPWDNVKKNKEGGYFESLS